MHCQKTTTIRCFLEATYDLLVVLRKPWIYTLCFDAYFSKIRDFWWFLVIFNRKMDILDHFWGPLTASCPKVTIYLPLTPRTPQDLLKPCYFDLILHHFGPLLRVLAGGCGWAPYELPLGWRTCSGPLKPMPGTQILAILTTFGLLWKPRKWPHFDHFGP